MPLRSRPLLLLEPELEEPRSPRFILRVTSKLKLLRSPMFFAALFRSSVPPELELLLEPELEPELLEELEKLGLVLPADASAQRSS